VCTFSGEEVCSSFVAEAVCCLQRGWHSRSQYFYDLTVRVGGVARVRRRRYCGVEMEHDVDVWMRRREVGESEANVELCDRAAVGGEERCWA
jgi:hypothetical protein